MKGQGPLSQDDICVNIYALLKSCLLAVNMSYTLSNTSDSIGGVLSKVGISMIIVII